MKQFCTPETRVRVLMAFAKVARICIAILMLLVIPGIKYTVSGVLIGVAFGVTGLLLATHIIHDCASQLND